MDFFTTALFSLSPGIGGVIGWVRFRKIDPRFVPFLFLLWAGFANEAVSVLLMNYGFSNLFNYNIFALIEALLIFFQFERWKIIRLPLSFFHLAPLLTGFWLLEIFLRPSPAFCSYFIVGYSFAFALLSITTINQIIFKESSLLLKNPVFLICIAFLLYFSFSALTETFWIFGIQQSSSFRLHITALLNYINLFTNLIYAVAILWMPLKQEYILW